MRVLHRFGDIAHRCAFRHHHVNINAQPFGMEPARRRNAVRSVERVVRRLRVQHHAPIGLDHAARRNQQLIDVFLLDSPPADIDFYWFDLADQPGARTADPHARYAGVGHLLRAFDCIAHSICRRCHIGDIAALDALAGAVPGPEHDDFAVVGDTGNHRGNAERAEVDRADNTGNARRGHQFCSSLLACLVAVVAAAACLAAALAAAVLASTTSFASCCARPGIRR